MSLRAKRSNLLVNREIATMQVSHVIADLIRNPFRSPSLWILSFFFNTYRHWRYPFLKITFVTQPLRGNDILA